MSHIGRTGRARSWRTRRGGPAGGLIVLLAFAARFWPLLMLAAVTGIAYAWGWDAAALALSEGP